MRGASGRVLQAVVRRKLGLPVTGPALRARIVSAAGEEQAASADRVGRLDVVRR